jgi:hypothetical protein
MSSPTRVEKRALVVPVDLVLLQGRYGRPFVGATRHRVFIVGDTLLRVPAK